MPRQDVLDGFMLVVVVQLRESTGRFVGRKMSPEDSSTCQLQKYPEVDPWVVEALILMRSQLVAGWRFLMCSCLHLVDEPVEMVYAPLARGRYWTNPT